MLCEIEKYEYNEMATVCANLDIIYEYALQIAI